MALERPFQLSKTLTSSCSHFRSYRDKSSLEGFSPCHVFCNHSYGMSRSEQKCLSTLLTEGRAALATGELYMACAALANNGLTHELEKELSVSEQMLLQARRALNRGELEKAMAILQKPVEQRGIYEGDRFALLAQAFHRLGDVQKAAEAFDQAIELFKQAGDEHRELRAAINRLICFSDARSSTVGSLFVLEQRARRSEYYDLAAGVQRTRAIELLRECRLSEATEACRDSLRSYELDGCPEDRLIAMSLLAILEVLGGNLKAAEVARNSVFPVDRRAAVYLQAFDSIVAGRIPPLPKGHALDAIPWKKLMLKPASVPGKILAALKEKPLTRNQLIEAVWGPRASHPSYRNRLYTAVNAARKAHRVDIIFDGETYRLRSGSQSA